MCVLFNLERYIHTKKKKFKPFIIFKALAKTPSLHNSTTKYLDLLIVVIIVTAIETLLLWLIALTRKAVVWSRRGIIVRNVQLTHMAGAGL